MGLYAPRILNEPVRWRFSAFRCTSGPTSRESVSERKTGVTRATPSRRSRAASISGSPGAVSVTANVEHLLKDLTNSAQRVELAALHFVEQTPKLRIVRHRMLEMLLRTRGGDGEDLAREIPPPPLLELPRLLEVGAMRLDLLPQLGHVLAARCIGQHDRRPPLAVGIEREYRAHLVQHRLRGGVVHLVHCDHIWDRHD